MENTKDDFLNTGYVQAERCIETPSQFAKDSLLYVQECGILQNQPNYISSRTCLNSYLIVVIKSGKGFTTLNQKQMPINDGTCVFMNCGAPYSYNGAPDSLWSFSWLHFNGINAKSYYEYFIRNADNLFSVDDTSQIENDITRIYQNTQAKPKYYELINASLITELLTTLITSNKKKNIPSNRPASTIDETLCQIEAYLKEHYTEPIFLDALSQKFCISKFYLCREFHRKYCIGLDDYIKLLQINRSKQLLRLSTEKIGNIAKIAGFNDPSYFVKLFKKYEGMTPSQYQKTWKEI